MSHLWVHLLLAANHRDRDELFGGKRITCRPGQFTTGRDQLAKKTGLHRSSIERLLQLLEIEQQIEQQKSNQNRLITIINWERYQNTEQQVEHQPSNDRATIEQRPSTLKECKNRRIEELKNKPPTPLNQEPAIPDDLILNKPELLDWWNYKKQRGEAYKPAGWAALLRKVRGFGPGTIKESIENCMANNWAGLFEKNGGSNGVKRNSGIGIKAVGEIEREGSKFAGVIRTITVGSGGGEEKG